MLNLEKTVSSINKPEINEIIEDIKIEGVHQPTRLYTIFIH